MYTSNKEMGYIRSLSISLLIAIKEKIGVGSIENASKHKVDSNPLGEMVHTKVYTF
jgi:hypothetical protein